MALTVMAGLVPAIHVVQPNGRFTFDRSQRDSSRRRKSRIAWMAGHRSFGRTPVLRPAMTENAMEMSNQPVYFFWRCEAIHGPAAARSLISLRLVRRHIVETAEYATRAASALLCVLWRDGLLRCARNDGECRRRSHRSKRVGPTYIWASPWSKDRRPIDVDRPPITDEFTRLPYGRRPAHARCPGRDTGTRQSSRGSNRGVAAPVRRSSENS